MVNAATAAAAAAAPVADVSVAVPDFADLVEVVVEFEDPLPADCCCL